MINNKLDFIDNFKFIINKCIKKRKDWYSRIISENVYQFSRGRPLPIYHPHPSLDELFFSYSLRLLSGLLLH